MNEGTCIHYTGILRINPREASCNAGVFYWDKFDGDAPGILLRAPCVQFRILPAHGKGTYVRPGEPTVRQEIDRKGQAVMPCEYLQLPTAEEVERDRIADKAELDKAVAALNVASAWRVTPKPATDRHEVIECPACKGRLHLSQSCLNGHVHGACETKGCVSWME